MKNKKTPEQSKKLRIFYDFRKMKRYDGTVTPYGAIGCDYTLDLFHKQAQCVCGSPLNCKCKVDVPTLCPSVQKRKTKSYLTDPKPNLLFTIRHRKNPSICYNYYSKNLSDALDEIARLNNKNKRTTEDGFYLDESGFDEKWNRAVIADYKAYHEAYCE